MLNRHGKFIVAEIVVNEKKRIMHFVPQSLTGNTRVKSCFSRHRLVCLKQRKYGKLIFLSKIFLMKKIKYIFIKK